MKLKTNPLVSILLLVVISSLWLYALNRWNEPSNKKREKPTLFNAELSGVLLSKRHRSSYQTIWVNNRKDSFVFKPKISASGSLFHANTEIGDSIIKTANSDTIIVKSSNTVYTYQFEE